MSEPTASADKNQVEATERVSEAKKYRNRHQVPRAFDCPSHGGVSLGGKKMIWLWPEDITFHQVADLIERGCLVPWEDGEIGPEERPIKETGGPAGPLRGVPAVTKVKTKTGVVEVTQPQAFGEVVHEGEAANAVAGNSTAFTPPDAAADHVETK